MNEVPPARRWPAPSRILRLASKELRETLRDRRTIVTLVLMPLLIYPLLSLAFRKFLLSNLQPGGERVYAIGIDADEFGPYFVSLVERGEELLAEREPDGADDRNRTGRTEEGEGFDDPATAPARAEWFRGADVAARVNNLEIDVGVQIRPLAGRAGRPPPLECTLVYRENSLVSREAVHWLERRLDAANQERLQTRLRARGVPDRLPVQFRMQSLEPEGSGGSSLATLIPLILILMTITGAVYPAIDLTAGERERGTLETLIAAPVPRLGLLLGKYVAVVTVALLTATVNLLAMTVVILATPGLGAVLFGEGGLSLLAVLQVFVLMVLFAAFFSGVLLALTSFARSFKEAQAYLIPVMVLAIAPGLLTLMPGVELNGILALTPLMNIVLLARDLFADQGSPNLPWLAVVTVASTAVYTVLTISLAARVFGTDALLYGSRGTWSDMWRARGRLVVPHPAVGLLATALVWLVYYLLGNQVPKLGEESLSRLLLMNAGITAVTFIGLPVLFGLALKVRLPETFRLHVFSPASALLAVGLGLVLWTLAHELFLFGSWLGFATLSESEITRGEQVAERMRQVPLLIVIISIAVITPVAEEAFFRGFLFSSLRSRLGPTATIVATGGLFGLFHMLSPAVLTPERLLPSTFLGLVLGWLAWRTGSVVPGILLHATHNGLLVTLNHYRDELLERGIGVEQQSHLPAAWLAAAGAGVVVCVLLVQRSTRPTRET